MKIKALPSILALFLLSFATAQLAVAQSSASGSYQFSLEDGYTRLVEFDARSLDNGSATGSMILTDEAPISYQDVDGTGDRTLSESYKGYYFKAEFDRMVVNKNQAVISGTIMDSSIKNLIGQRVLLTVEDNADNPRVQDRLTWGLYRTVAIDWKSSDAELKEDSGVGLRWWATDYERKDDVGYAMPRATNEPTSTQTFPTTSYAYIAPEKWAGDIKVVQ
ncbi:MAG TPA: hypothetical protein VM095_21085 [Pyrinomonadaceae bacterium]|nr:hypothetical protein [Pyrinomonadaceae bacterium]